MYDCIKPKYGDRAKLCYMDTDSFVIYIKTKDCYKDIACDVERWFHTSNYDENDKRPLPIGKNKKYQAFLKMNYAERLRHNLLHLQQKHMHT